MKTERLVAVTALSVKEGKGSLVKVGFTSVFDLDSKDGVEQFYDLISKMDPGLFYTVIPTTRK